MRCCAVGLRQLEQCCTTPLAMQHGGNADAETEASYRLLTELAIKQIETEVWIDSALIKAMQSDEQDNIDMIAEQEQCSGKRVMRTLS